MKSLLLQNQNGARETLKEIGISAVGIQLEIIGLMKDFEVPHAAGNVNNLKYFVEIMFYKYQGVHSQEI